MTDKVLEEARRRIAEHQTIGNRNAILAGDWDSGSLIQEQVKEILRDRAEAEGE